MLARYGFIEDDPGHGGGRERWWRAAHELTTWSTTSFFGGEPDESDPRALGRAERLRLSEAARQFLRRVGTDYARWQLRWIEELESWDPVWQEAAEMSDLALRLTPEQLKSLNEELLATIFRYRDGGPAGDGAERVMIVLQAFPQRGELP